MEKDDAFKNQEEKPSENTDNLNKPITNIKEIGQSNIPELKSNIYCLSIIGQIEGHAVLPNYA